MDLQSSCSLFSNQAPLWTTISPLKAPTASPLLCSSLKNPFTSHFGVPRHHHHLWVQDKLKLKWTVRKSSVTVSAHDSSQLGRLNFSRDVKDGSEPLRGKPGSVSFLGLTYQSVEESKLVSAPMEENAGSFVWVLAPVALISSFLLPRFFIGSNLDELFKNDVLSEIVSTFISEVVYYIGFAIFLRITDHVQEPYLQFSAKRWSLITGLRGYLASAFFTMGFKFFAPLFMVYVTWPVLGLPALVSVAPFLFGFLIQYAFEKILESRGSSSWPLVPILFEVYRIYQLARAASFIEKLMYSMKDAPMSQQLVQISGASVSMIVTFQILSVFCLWSLLTFLLRLFPSRPVAENY